MTVMKRQNTSRVLFALVLVAVSAGCETVPTSGPDALVGQWTNSLGTVWTINPDSTFHVATTKPKAQIWGTYTVSGDTITVQETRQSGKVPKHFGLRVSEPRLQATDSERYATVAQPVGR